MCPPKMRAIKMAFIIRMSIKLSGGMLQSRVQPNPACDLLFPQLIHDRLCGPQRLKYLLSCPLQRKFADACYKEMKINEPNLHTSTRLDVQRTSFNLKKARSKEKLQYDSIDIKFKKPKTIVSGHIFRQYNYKGKQGSDHHKCRKNGYFQVGERRM